MPPKLVKQPVNVVEIDSGSDDEEDGVTVVSTTNKSSSSNRKPQPQPQPPKPTPAPPNHQTLECRSFWKAGAYSVGPTSGIATTQGHITMLSSPNGVVFFFFFF